MTEAEVFGEQISELKIIKRNPEGKDKIIDVLVKNDKDPVEIYYDSALEFCNKAKAALKKLSS